MPELTLSVVATHHVFQQSLIDHPLIQLIGGRNWIELNANKLNLTTSFDIAQATGTPLHLSNHPWIASHQRALLEGFMDRIYGNKAVADWLDDGVLDQGLADLIKADALDYVNDIRDTTAKALLNGDLALTLQDPRFPGGLTSDAANLMADNVFSQQRFAFDAASSAARDVDLAALRTARTALEIEGLDTKWLAFDTPEKMLTYIQGAKEEGVNPYNTRSATQASLGKYIEHIDDGRIAAYADGVARQAGVPQSAWGKLSLGAKIGIIGLVTTTAVGIYAANSSSTVAERNALLKDLAVATALEAGVMAAGFTVAPAAIITIAGYFLYKYATDAETRQTVDDFLEKHVELAPQVVTRLLTGQSLLPGATYTQLVAAPDARMVPYLSNVMPVPPMQGPVPDGFDFGEYVTALQSDWGSFWIGKGNIGITREDAENNRAPYTVEVIYAGPIPIAFITTSNLPAYEGANGETQQLPPNTLVLMVVGEPGLGGNRGWVPIGTQGIPTPLSGQNIQELGSAIYNDMRRAARTQGLTAPEVNEKQSSNGNVVVSTRLITYGPDRYIEIQVSERGYNLPINSATTGGGGAMVSRDNISAHRSGSGATSSTITRTVTTEAAQGGTAQTLAQYSLTRNTDGTYIYKVDGQVISEELAKAQHGEVFLSMLKRQAEAESGFLTADPERTSTQIANSAARDLQSAQAGNDGISYVSVTKAQEQINGQFTGNSIVSVSARLVASRLAQNYGESGTDVVTKEEYERRFGDDVNAQVRQIQFAGQIGGVFGSTLGRALGGDDVLVGTLLGGVLGSITTSVGQAIGTGFATDSVSQGFHTGLAELPNNLARAGVGAVSSLLTAELIKAIGLDGFAGDLANTAAGAVIGQIAANAVGLNGAKALKDVLAGVNATLVFSAVGSFLGSRLAAEVIQFDTVGGQLGSAVGSALGSLGMAKLFASMGLIGGPLGAFVGAFVGAFLGFIAGGLIGSVFGGTPRSGADVIWDESSQSFQMANAYSKHGGSKDAAKQTAKGVADTFNFLLATTGGRLEDPSSVQTGNYGMRKDKFVYRPVHTRDKDDITKKFGGEDAGARLISYGMSQGLNDPDFKIVGGDVYVKRALYNSPALTGTQDGTVDLQALAADLAIARDWSFYRNNPGVVEAIGSGLSGGERDIYLAGWIATAARATDLALDRRHAADWYGGFQYLFQDADASAATTEFYFDYDFENDKYSRGIRVGRYTLTDAVDVARQTFVELGSANDTLDLRQGRLADQRGIRINGSPNNDIAAAGEDFTALNNTVFSVTESRMRSAVEVAVAPNAAGELTEQFELAVTDSTGVAQIGPDATITIVGQNDLSYLKVGRSYATESEGYLVFRVSLSRAATADVTVSLSVDGTQAVVDADFLSSLQVSTSADTGWSSASVVTFAAGQTEYFVRVPIVQDDAGGTGPRESNEEMMLGARVTAGQAVLSNGDSLVTGIGTIVERQSSQPLTWVDDVVAHAGRPVSVSVGFSSPVPSDTSVTVSTFDRQILTIDIAATIDAGAGNDTVHASDLGDNILGMAGEDVLYGGRLDDWLIGGDGNDRLDAGSGTGLGGDGNYLDGGAGDDVITGREGSDWLEGGDGVDQLVGGAGGDILAGGSGEGDDLEGGAGDDIYLVRRGDGADSAEDAANDAPVANPQRGGDAISQRFEAIRLGSVKRDWLARSAGVDQGKIAGGEDSVTFGIGIELGDVQLARAANGRDLIIRLSEIDAATGTERLTGDVLTVTDWFADPFKRVEWLKFVDGTEVRIADVTSFIVGTSGDDLLIGTTGRDFVYGGAGNDELYLLAGDDIGSGGSGDDLVSGGADDDLIVGGLGVDKLIGGSGNDALSGDASNDDLYGGAGKDILSGGRGDGDLVVGGAGDDRFKYARGDGHDTAFDDYADHWATIWQGGQWINGYQYNAETSEIIAPDGSYVRKNFGTAEEPDLRWLGRFDYDELTNQLRRFEPPAGATTVVSNKGVDTIEFALDINIQDIILTRPTGTDDIRLTVSRENSEGLAQTGADSLTLKDWYDAPGSIERLAFYQTGEIDISASGYRLVAGSDDADGSDAAPLRGSDGKDWVTGAGGDDVIAGGLGEDIIAGNSGSDYLKGEGGDDVVYGGAGNDVLDGGAGRDILSGGRGLDTASYASTSAGATVLLTETAMNTGDAVGDTFDSIENLIGGGGADTLGGDEGDNELAGGKGSDMLLGGLGSDTYVWNIGDGTDTIQDIAFAAREVVGSGGELLDGYTSDWIQGELRSGSGANARYYWGLQVTGPDGAIVYSYDRFMPKGAMPAVPSVSDWPDSGWMEGLSSEGQAVRGLTYDSSVNAGDADAIELGAGVSLSDLVFEREGNDLIISYVKVEDGNNGAGNAIGVSNKSSLAVRGHFTENGRIESLVLADGLTVSLASILSATTSDLLVGAAGDDLITGQRGVRVDNLDGGAGNDVLAGGEGDDNLMGSTGDDILEGGLGADTLDGGAHTPYDPMASVSAEQPVSHGDEARYATSAAGVVIDLASAAAQTGGDAQGDILRNIENVRGSAYVDTISGNADANLLRGLAGDDRLVGRDGDDVLTGDGGNDNLSGDAGEDDLSGGEGNDILSGGSGKDLLAGDDGDDQLLGGDGDDFLSAAQGDDRLEAGMGDDQLLGGDGNDILTGAEGKDQLTGESGNDLLMGGSGDDSYLFSAGFGRDVLTDIDGKNEILIDGSISYDRLWFEQKGNDLVISVRGTEDQMTVTGFFASEQASRVYSIQTSTHRLFIGHPDTRNFIAAMTAASAGGVPSTIPESVAALMPRYWHAGTQATPYGIDFALSIDEDNGTGSIAVGAIDHDENIASYRVGTDAEHGAVTIDQAGAFAYSPGANFNGSDSFTVVIIDADNLSREVTVNVAVAAIDDAPVISGIEGGSIAERAIRSATAGGSVAGSILATEVDGEPMVFALTNDAGGRFAIDIDGLISVRDADLLNHEANAEHLVSVRVTDSVGSYSEQSFTIRIIDVNEENRLPAAYAWSIDENVASDAVVGQVIAEDPDKPGLAFGEQRFHFWYEDGAHELSSDGRYRIDVLTGEIRVAGGLNFEGGSPEATYEVIARDNRGEPGFTESRTSVTIAINDLNEANSFAGPNEFTLSENESTGKLLGLVSAADPDTLGTAFAEQRYSFWDGTSASLTSSDGRFAIDEITGAITATASFDYEDDVREATYTIVARDNRGATPGHSAFTNATIRLANVNETPETPVLTYAVGNLADGAAGDTVVARFSLADPDRTVPALVVDSNPGGLLTITGDELRLAADINFEDLVALGLAVTDADGDGRNDITVTLNLHASDGELVSAGSTPVSLTIEDVNEAPLSLDFAAALGSIDERDRPVTGASRPAVVIGALSVSDPDTAGYANASYVYTIDDARFEIIGGILRLREGVSLDFESEQQVSLIITATDQGVDPLSISRTLTFAIADRDDILDGTADADTLDGQSGRDIVHGLASDDLIRGHAGDDELYGDDGADQLLGGAGADRLEGGSDADKLDGGTGDDHLLGGSGADQLTGGVGQDLIEGALGDDVIVADDDAKLEVDTIDGGDGVDTLSFAHFSAGVTADFAAAQVIGDTVRGVENVEGTAYSDTIGGNDEANRLSGGDGVDSLAGRGGDDHLLGGSGADILSGDAGSDRLDGGADGDSLSAGSGNDTLVGGEGNDDLRGEEGDDYLEAGGGNDIVDGGAGNDSYIIDRQSNHDTVFNYDATGDEIDVIGFQDTHGAIEERDLWFERQGDDLLVTVIGADTSVLVKNWYLAIDPDSRANHRIDFFIAGERFTREANVEGLVDFMAGFSRPADQAGLDALLADPDYEVRVATYFGINAPPTITGIVDQRIDEDGSILLTLTVSDDITPSGGIALTREILAGGSLFGPEGIELGPVQSDGMVTLRLTPLAHAAGTATIALTAEDAGGISVTQQLVLTINPVADTPLITQFVGGAGTSGGAGVALSLSVEFPDRDGSEVQQIEIGGVPTGVTLSQGSFNAASGLWTLRPDQLAGLAVLAPQGWSQDLILNVIAHSSEAGSAASAQAVTTAVLNAPPTAIVLSNAVNENAANGSIVGQVSGLDPDGNDTLTYELLDNAEGRFGLSTDGLLRVADGTRLDHEANASHGIRVRVTDEFGESIERALTVDVANLNEANSLAQRHSYSIDENLAAGTVVGHIQASDPDGTGTAFAEQRYYFRTGDGVASVSVDGLFLINSVTGVITTVRSLDHETDQPAEYEVVARDNRGLPGANEALTRVAIAIRNLNEANGLPTSINLSVAENQGIGALVGTIDASDFDQETHPFGEQRYYFLVGDEARSTSADARFTIDAITGEIRTARTLDHESSDASTSHVVIARDNRGASPFNQSTAGLSIATANANEAPTIAVDSASVLFDESGLGEGSATAGGRVTSYILSDPDGGSPSLEFVEGSNPNGWFEIEGSNVRFADDFSISFLAARDWAASQGISVGDHDGDGRADVRLARVSVYASDGALPSAVATTDIYIENVPQEPNAPIVISQTLASETLAGGSPHAGQVIAQFALSDPDGTVPALSIESGDTNGWFSIVGDRLVFASNVNFSADWLRANAGTLGIDAGFSSDVDGDGLREIRVARLGLISTDGDNQPSNPTSFDVLIEDRNEGPSFSAASYGFAVAENAASYSAVGRVSGGDIDGPANELRYGFSGGLVYRDTNLGRDVSKSADGRLLVDVATGELFVAPGANLDADSGTTNINYGIVVTDRVGDRHALSATAQLSLAINGVNEPHTLVSASGSIHEVSGLPPLVPVFNLLPMMLSDPEGSNMQWSFADGSTVNGIWTISSDGKISLTDGSVDYEALTRTEWEEQIGVTQEGEPIYRTRYGRDPSLATMPLQIRAYDASSGVMREATFTATVTDVNEAATYSTSVIPKDSGGAVLKQNDNLAWVTYNRRGGGIIQIVSSDPEGSGLTYSISNMQAVQEVIYRTNNADTKIDADRYPTVTINSTTGVISFDGDEEDGQWEGGVKIGGDRRESQLTYRFTINITDADGVNRSEDYTLIFLRRYASAPPVVFDLDGDGLELVPLIGSNVNFDMDADGVADRTGWVAPDDGMLALDRNGNGTIDDVSEISFISDVAGAVSDLEGLAAFDSNADGVLDASDARFADFRIWRDRDQDGVSDEGELVGLAEAGITSFSLTGTLTGANPDTASDNIVYSTSTFTRPDGTTGTVGDVFLAYERSNIETIAAPVILDYDGDGQSLVSIADSNVRFNQDGDAETERTGWFEAGDAMLALDRDGDGAITNISEISFVGDLAGAKTDLEGLSAFDTNRNGLLDAGDRRFAAFRLWFDSNSNGISDAGELKSLSEAGVSAISLRSTTGEGDGRQAGGNMIYGRGAFAFDDGRIGTLFDAGLAYLPEANSSTVALAGAESTDTPSTPQPDGAPALQFDRMNFDRKAKKYVISSIGGELTISLRKAGTVDPRAGAVGGATIFRFSNTTIGMLSPIILDLDGDGLELKSRKKSDAHFDMDGNGSRDDTGWVGKGDGMLVIDRNNDGLVNDGSELSFLTENEDARSDLQALASLDSDRDGKISATDRRFGELKIWRDANGNGVTDQGELKTLAEHGIASISLAARATDAQATVGSNILLATSTFTRSDGSMGTVGDVALAFKPTATVIAGPEAPFERFGIEEAGRAPSPQLQALRAANHAGWQGRLDPHLFSEGVDAFALYANDDDLAATSTPQSANELIERDVCRLPKVLPREAVTDGISGPLEDCLFPTPGKTVAHGAGGDHVDGDTVRLALMSQDLAAFGVSRGEGLTKRHDRNSSGSLDYFVAQC